MIYEFTEAVTHLQHGDAYNEGIVDQELHVIIVFRLQDGDYVPRLETARSTWVSSLDAFGGDGFQGTSVGKLTAYDPDTGVFHTRWSLRGHGYGVLAGWELGETVTLTSTPDPEGAYSDAGTLSGYVFRGS